jgi:hypothetical protein
MIHLDFARRRLPCPLYPFRFSKDHPRTQLFAVNQG